MWQRLWHPRVYSVTLLEDGKSCRVIALIAAFAGHRKRREERQACSEADRL